MSWPALSGNSNVFKSSYISGFLDVSGKTLLRQDLIINARLFVDSYNNTINTTSLYEIILSEDISLNGRLFLGAGAGINLPTTNNYILDVSGSSQKTGTVRIFESAGTLPSATTGSLVLQHDDASGVSSISFPSKSAFGKDFASIAYYESISGGFSGASKYNYYGDVSSTTSSALVFNVQRDNFNSTDVSSIDSIILQATGSIILDACSTTLGQTIIQPRGGNIGIGKTFPISTLDVSGNMNVTNDVSFNNRIFVTGNTYLNSLTNSTSSTTGALQITGGVGITGNVYVGSNIVSSGNITATGNLYITDGTNTSNLFMNASVLTSGNIIALTNNTASTSTVTGTLRVTGGLGITGNVYTGGNIISNAGTVSTNTSSGTLQVTGGVGITGNVYIGGNIVSSGNITATGNLYITNGTNTSNLYMNGAFLTNGNIVALTNNTVSTSTVSGTLQVTGGVGITGNVYVGGIVSPSTWSSGQVIQVFSYSSLNATLTSGSFSGTSYVTVFSFNITPKSTNSLINVHFDCYWTFGGWGSDAYSTRLLFGTTQIAYKEANFYAQGTYSGTYVSIIGRRCGSALFPLSGLYKNTSTSTLTCYVQGNYLTGTDIFGQGIGTDDGVSLGIWQCRVEEIQA